MEGGPGVKRKEEGGEGKEGAGNYGYSVEEILHTRGD